VIEYFGPGVKSLSCTGKGTITNMGAELGATTSIFPYDERMDAYLRGTDREEIADLARRHPELLGADSEVAADPGKFFDRVIEIDLSTLEPQVTGPHTPDLARPVSKLAAAVAKEGYPDELRFALIGSCTNSSYEDMGRAAQVADEAAKMGLRTIIPLMVTPGSESVRATIERDGQMASLQSIGATVLANACGPCIGQWKRDDLEPGKKNSIISSFNRNFPRRNDGSADTLSFISSPEMVVAFALAGRLSFNPMKDPLKLKDGEALMLTAPSPSPDLPEKGFVRDDAGYQPPARDASDVEVKVSPNSERLQILAPFPPWDGKDFEALPVLLKAKGKCTTDHISPAGPWLRFRGHLDKISDNMFNGAVNAFTGAAGKGLNQTTGEREQAFSKIARGYRAAGVRWVAVGDENYGEGSSREHAAMSPRFLGAAAVISRSFARIHESNLKKQGVLPLTFANASDYDKMEETDRVSILGLNELAPGKPLRALLHHADGTREEFMVNHTLNQEQIEWFKAGSALNVLKGS
jgi:aconitate hydratase